MKITSLIEDTTTQRDLYSEKGLSIHIEREKENLLFDTGTSGKFIDNANKLEVNLEEVDVTTISHGHFDHAGGLRRFFETNTESPVYLRTHSEEGHYFKGFLFIKRDIGMDKDLLNDYSHRINQINQFKEISKGVYLLPDISLKYPIPAGSKYLYKKDGHKLVPDDFAHEQMMVIQDEDGLVIFTGCSHHGVLNMVETAIAKFPDTPIKGLFGSFHFIGLPFFNHMAESRSSVESIGKQLLQYPIEKVYTGHCTGRKAYPILKKVMGDRVDYFSTGSCVEL